MRALCVASALAACGGPPAPSLPWNEPPPNQREPVEEAEPDDGVQVVGTKGRTDPEAVNAGLAARRAELSGCYLQNVGKRRWLGGKLIVHWDIAADGAIARVLLTESDLGAWPIEKCLLEVARTATFGKPVGGKAEFTVPLAFSATGPVSVWDAEAGKAVGTQLAKLDECAKQKGVKGGSPRGLVVTLYVGPQGKVQSVGFASAKSVLDDLWADCAEQAVLAWKLPDPKGTIAKLAVKYR
jgi:hypothetical protein